jgi:hypothetical protein
LTNRTAGLHVFSTSALKDHFWPGTVLTIFVSSMGNEVFKALYSYHGNTFEILIYPRKNIFSSFLELISFRITLLI